MIIASNNEIEVDGMPNLFSGYETTITVKLASGGTSQYVDIFYNSVLSIPTTRYWFDANGEIALPFGDLLRAMCEKGITGAGVQIMQVIDSATSTTLTVTAGVYYGIIPVAANVKRFPPRKCIAWGAPQDGFFIGNQVTPETFDLYESNDGTTWTQILPSVTTDIYGEAKLRMPTMTLGAKFAKVCASGQTEPLWQCRQMTEWCGDTFVARWKSDTGKDKIWAFELLSVEREQTDSRTTEGAGVLRSTYFPTQKNWKLKVTVKVSDLAVDETWYFDDLVTGEITQCTMTEYHGISYLSIFAGAPVAAVVTDKKISRSLIAQTTDLTFNLDVMKIRNF